MRKFVRNVPFIYKFIVGCLLLAAVFFVTMLLGAADTSIRDVWLALSSGQTSKTITLIREIRLPRELGAAFVGAGLAVSGAMMQGMTRNPLADPGLLGLTAGANAALALALALLPGANTIVIVFACLIGAAVGTLLVFGIGSLKTGGFSPFRIVLAGAAVSAFLQAVAEGTGLYFHLSKDVAMWTAGGLISTAWPQLQVVMPFILVGLVIAFMLSRQLTILSLNQEVAVGLGQRTTRVRTVMFLVVILLAGAAVALVGNLAFIGLMKIGRAHV